MKRACLLAWLLSLLLLASSAFGQSAGPTRVLVLDPESKFLSPKELAGLGNHLRSLAAKYPSLKVLKAPGRGLAELLVPSVFLPRHRVGEHSFGVNPEAIFALSIALNVA